MLALNVLGYATQTPPASVDEAGRTLERCLAEVERLRATCHTTGEIRSLEGRLKAATELLAAYKSQIDHLNSLVESSSSTSTMSAAEHAERFKIYEQRLTVERTEAARLRKENGSLRKSRNIFLSIMIGAGVALAWALTSHGQ